MKTLNISLVLGTDCQKTGLTRRWTRNLSIVPNGEQRWVLIDLDAARQTQQCTDGCMLVGAKYSEAYMAPEFASFVEHGTIDPDMSPVLLDGILPLQWCFVRCFVVASVVLWRGFAGAV